MIDEIVLTHGRTTNRATLFLHGLTASPLQFAALARYVYASGENVYVPRLPRHGHEDRLTETLRDLRADELIAHAGQTLAYALRLGRTVRVVGFSLGGLMATWMAQHHELEHAVVIAPLLGLAMVPSRYSGTLARTLLELPNAFFWWNPFLRERRQPTHTYPRFPTHALAQSLLVAEDVFHRASLVAPRTPITFVTNAGETTVNNAAVARLAVMWEAGGAVRVERHVITGLGLSHDIIEPFHLCARVKSSYPVLHALLDRTAG